MIEKFERYIFKHAVQPLKLVAVVAIAAELSRRGLMFIDIPAFTSFRGLTLSGTKTHVKQLWLRKTKGSGEDPLVC